jgi:hypothetical protein
MVLHRLRPSVCAKVCRKVCEMFLISLSRESAYLSCTKAADGTADPVRYCNEFSRLDQHFAGIRMILTDESRLKHCKEPNVRVCSQTLAYTESACLECRIRVESSSVTTAKPQVVVVVWIWPAGPQRMMEDCGWQCVVACRGSSTCNAECKNTSLINILLDPTTTPFFSHPKSIKLSVIIEELKPVLETERQQILIHLDWKS